VIGAHRLEVDETVFGNMGTFYRVRLGPFAAADESKALCSQLRTKGYDCLVVTE
jgi:cell division septation protein DedD